MAQRWADQCTYDHDRQRGKLDGTTVGQNIAMESSTAKKNEAAVQAWMVRAAQLWYDEVTKPGFDSENINPYT